MCRDYYHASTEFAACRWRIGCGFPDDARIIKSRLEIAGEGWALRFKFPGRETGTSMGRIGNICGLNFQWIRNYAALKPNELCWLRLRLKSVTGEKLFWNDLSEEADKIGAKAPEGQEYPSPMLGDPEVVAEEEAKNEIGSEMLCRCQDQLLSQAGCPVHGPVRPGRCWECFWWKRTAINAFTGTCRRFPNSKCKAGDDYCGEFWPRKRPNRAEPDEGEKQCDDS